MIQEELKNIFAKFNLTVVQVQARLLEIEMPEFSQYLQYPPKRAWAQHVYFAMASLILDDVHSVFEIGTGSGASTNTLAKLFSDSIIYTIDVGPDDPNWKGTWKSKHSDKVVFYNKNLDHKNIKIIECNSFFLPALELPERFDLIYVDGDHQYPVVASDISFAYSHLRKGGFLFMHDYEIRPAGLDVNYVVNWMREHIKEEVLEFPMFISKNNLKANLKMACLVKD